MRDGPAFQIIALRVGFRAIEVFRDFGEAFPGGDAVGLRGLRAKEFIEAERYVCVEGAHLDTGYIMPPATVAVGLTAVEFFRNIGGRNKEELHRLVTARIEPRIGRLGWSVRVGIFAIRRFLILARRALVNQRCLLDGGLPEDFLRRAPTIALVITDLRRSNTPKTCRTGNNDVGNCRDDLSFSGRKDDPDSFVLVVDVRGRAPVNEQDAGLLGLDG